MSDLHALAERIETAAGPDREIDAALEAWAYELDNDAQADIVCDSDNAERGHYWVSIDGGRTLYSSAPLTSSLDAAVALCERALPECWWEIEREFVYDKGELRERYTGRVRRSRDAFMHVYGAPTPALALCLAVVRAKIAATPETPASAAETGEDRG